MTFINITVCNSEMKTTILIENRGVQKGLNTHRYEIKEDYEVE
jgi:hypothetical protein